MYTRTRVGTLLFRSFALRSFALIYIDLVALYKRATVSELLFIYFEKRFDQKTFFLYVFDSFSQFSHLFMPKERIALVSLRSIALV